MKRIITILLFVIILSCQQQKAKQLPNLEYYAPIMKYRTVYYFIGKSMHSRQESYIDYIQIKQLPDITEDKK